MLWRLSILLFVKSNMIGYLWYGGYTVLFLKLCTCAFELKAASLKPSLNYTSNEYLIPSLRPNVGLVLIAPCLLSPLLKIETNLRYRTLMFQIHHFFILSALSSGTSAHGRFFPLENDPICSWPLYFIRFWYCLSIDDFESILLFGSHRFKIIIELDVF